MKTNPNLEEYAADEHYSDQLTNVNKRPTGTRQKCGVSALEWMSAADGIILPVTRYLMKRRERIAVETEICDLGEVKFSSYNEVSIFMGWAGRRPARHIAFIYLPYVSGSTF